MTTKEFGILAAAIKTYYPRENIFPTDKSMEMWYEELKDLDYKMASMQVKRHVATKKYPPTIADIRECLVNFSTETELNPMQAWELVLEAMDDISKNGLANKRFNQLPESIKKAIGGYRQFSDMLDNPNTIRFMKSDFMENYKKILEAERGNKMLQPDIRNAIEANAHAELPQKDEEEEEKLIGDEWVDL